MPGIFSSCIISNRPGLSSCRSLGKPDIRRARGFGSCIKSSKYSSETSRTESSYGSIHDAERSFTSIRIDDLRSQGSDVSSSSTSTISATRHENSASTTRGFYSNKEHNAMIFTTKSDNSRNVKRYGRVQNQRQYQPSPSPCPCEWGYFVDTA